MNFFVRIGQIRGMVFVAAQTWIVSDFCDFDFEEHHRVPYVLSIIVYKL